MNRTRDLIFYVSVGAGMALATSVFTMIGGLFAVAGTTWIVLSIVLAGLSCAAIALSIGELASMYPSAPGIRTYFKAAFGSGPSLLAVYLYLTFAVIVAGLESFVFSSVVRMAVPGMSSVVTVLLLLLTVVVTNLAGFQLPRGLQIGSTVGAFLLVLVASAWGVLNSTTAPLSQTPTMNAQDSLAKLPSLIGMSIFLFTGFEWVTPLGLRPAAYRRQIPGSMLIGLFVLAVTYAGFVLGAANQVAPQRLANSIAPQVLLFRQLYGQAGVYAALALSILAIFSTFNAGILGGSQLIYLLGRDGSLPEWCGTLSLRAATPTSGIIILGGLATVSSILVLTFELQIAAALIGATIMCGVYSGFVLCGLKLKGGRVPPSQKFANPIPRLLQALLAVALLIVGYQTLFSEPAAVHAAIVGLIGVIAVAMLLTFYSNSLRQRAARQALGSLE